MWYISFQSGVGYLQGSAFLLNGNTSYLFLCFSSVSGPFEADWV